MVISGVFMMIFVIGMVVLGVMLPRTSTKLFAVFSLMVTGKAGGTLSQILAVIPAKKYQRKTGSSLSTVNSSTALEDNEDEPARPPAVVVRLSTAR